MGKEERRKGRMSEVDADIFVRYGRIDMGK